MPLNAFHPLVAEWFVSRFGSPTDAQAEGWPAIAAGRDTLIAAPTGSGKTLAAFLYCLDRLLRDAFEQRLADEVQVLYVSPLRALSNDIERNLARPMAELDELAARRGLPPLPVRIAVRTGDTPAAERQKMARKPPQVLITTPESLYILLTAAKSREALRGVRTVIVDEIHAVAGNKRGAHLALSLERLESIARTRPVRIGLSATQKPLEEVARFLVGAARVDASAVPDCTIVDATRRREIDLAVEIPKSLELSSVASGEQWAEVYDRVAALAAEHQSTIVFCNTRRHVERAAHALGERLGVEAVAAHHGSLSHKIRRVAEQRLKAGEVKCVVATASLELGIDVGAVDLVVQLGSPRSLSVFIQRVGRSGHVRGGVPRGRLFATTRDELLECAAIVRAVRGGDLDRVRIREHPTDVLAQQMIAECAAAAPPGAGEDAGYDEDALFDLVRRAWPYRALERADFDRLVTVLSDGISTRYGRGGAHLHRDGVNHKLRGRRGARLAAITSGGAIPDNADYAVVAEPEGIRVGTLDEDFAIESLAGDIFLLGNTSWRIRRVESGIVRVEDAKGAPPNVPFWNGEAPGRSDEASAAVSDLREQLVSRLDGGGPESAVRQFLIDECGVDQPAAEQAVTYAAAARRALGVMPSHKNLVAERFFDEAGGMQLVIHAPFGARINRAWGLALRKRFCRSFNFELQAAATDDGIVLSLGPQHSFPLESVFQFLTPDALEPVLKQALLAAPMFATRWRWTTTRSLTLLRHTGGRRVPPQILRMRAEDLLAAVFPHAAACPENLPGGDIEIPSHPLVDETIRDCLTEPMDLEGARAVIARIESGEIAVHARDVAEASPLSHAILNANPYAFLDDAPLEERRTRAVMMRRTLPEADRGELSALDAEAIAQVVSEAWPEVRDADELHDLLLTLGVLGEGEGSEWTRHFESLRRSGRARRVIAAGEAFWIATERLPLVCAAWPDCRDLVDGNHGSVGAAAGSREAALGEEIGESREIGKAFSPTVAPSKQPPPLPELSNLSIEESAPNDDRRLDEQPERETARKQLVSGRMEFSGPITAKELAAKLALDPVDVDFALGAIESEGLVLRGRFRPGSSTGDNEWCHRRLLARIHSLTIGRLRKEIEPVSAAVLMRFLLRWQHVAPATQLHGAAGLAEVLGQLQGVDAAAGAWERDILPARIGAYKAEWLDLLCLRGEVCWGRLDLRVRDFEEGVRRVGLTRATPIAIVRREDLSWLLPDSDAERKASRGRVGPVAARLLDHLGLAGASFFTDLVRTTKLPPSQLEEAVCELVASGLVTADGFAALRSLLDDRRRALSTNANRRVRDYTPAPGRFCLFLLGADLASEEIREAWAKQLLRRYGVVFRDLVQRDCPLAWRELSAVYRRLEARGEIRGGRFVAGFVGEQFALPEAVESLRALRRDASTGEQVVIAATDPLNLVGTITPGPRVPGVTGNRILLVDGVPIASIESGQIVRRADCEDHQLSPLFAAPARPSALGGSPQDWL